MDRSAFAETATRHGIDGKAAQALYDELNPVAEQLSRPAESFEDASTLTRTVQTLIWLGVALVIVAHLWWSFLANRTFGIGLVLVLTLCWQVAFLGAAESARRRGWGSLEGGFAAIVASYTWVAVLCVDWGLRFGFGRLSFRVFTYGFHDGWLMVELASFAVAGLLFERYRRPFVVLPLTVYACFLAMDGTTRLVGGGWSDHAAVTLSLSLCGVAAIGAGVVLDYRGLRRFAFWPHVAGMTMVVASLVDFCDGSPAAPLVSAAIAFALGAWLARTSYLIGGALLAWAAMTEVTADVLGPVFFLASGIAFIGGAIWLARADSGLREWLAGRGLPAPQRDLAY